MEGDQDLWQTAQREWDIERAWECECEDFRGLQCEIPGKTLFYFNYVHNVGCV